MMQKEEIFMSTTNKGDKLDRELEETKRWASELNSSNARVFRGSLKERLEHWESLAVLKATDKQKITIRLDRDLIEAFKALTPDGKGYQLLINQALRDWLTAQSVKEMIRKELPGIVAEQSKVTKESKSATVEGERVSG